MLLGRVGRGLPQAGQGWGLKLGGACGARGRAGLAPQLGLGLTEGQVLARDTALQQVVCRRGLLLGGACCSPQRGFGFPAQGACVPMGLCFPCPAESAPPSPSPEEKRAKLAEAAERRQKEVRAQLFVCSISVQFTFCRCLSYPHALNAECLMTHTVLCSKITALGMMSEYPRTACIYLVFCDNSSRWNSHLNLSCKGILPEDSPALLRRMGGLGFRKNSLWFSQKKWLCFLQGCHSKLPCYPNQTNSPPLKEKRKGKTSASG